MSEKNPSDPAKMSAAFANNDEAYLVRQAASWADALIRHERKLHGVKTDRAISLAAQKHRIEQRVFNGLRYVSRWPKEISAGAYQKLESAITRIEPIDSRLERELRLADAAGLNADNSKDYRAAAAALGPKEGRGKAAS